MTELHIQGGRPLTGRCHVPGDKSISHRAVMFSAIADGDSTVRNFLDGGDCRATIGVMRGLGVVIEERSPTELVDPRSRAGRSARADGCSGLWQFRHDHPPVDRSAGGAEVHQFSHRYAADPPPADGRAS